MKPRSVAWMVAISFPLWFIPLWVGCWKLMGLSYLGLTTASGGLLLVISCVAARTDFQTTRIPNWITYTGIVWALALNGLHTWVGDETTNRCLGTIGIGSSLLGFATLFVGLLVIFSFSGGGAGDVKLVGAIGAFLGIVNGFEAVMLGFICGTLFSIVSIGQLFFRPAAPRSLPALEECQLAGTGTVPSELADSRQLGTPSKVELMKKKIRLGPFFAIGTILVLCRESGLFEFRIIGI